MTVSSSTSSATTPSVQDSDAASGSNNVGAIAGGTVGGIAGAALLIVVGILLVRQRRKNNMNQRRPEFQNKPAEADGDNAQEVPADIGAGSKRYLSHETEDPTKHSPSELDSLRQPAELAS